MGCFSGPKVESSQLVAAFDAANSKGFDAYENLALNSEAINSWANNGNAISISANSQIAPNGTLTADVLSQTAVTGASRWVSSMTRTYTAGVTYTLSIWLKKISGTDSQPTINLWVNGGTNQSVGTITTEWVRYSKSFTPASTISSDTYTGLNTGWSDTGVANNFTFAAWGFQVEIGSSASPYYPITATTKTRGTTLADLSGRSNTGALTYGPTYNSSNGGAIVFDGSNDCVVVNSNASVLSNTGYTKTVWFYITSFATNNNLISGGNNGRHAFSVSSSNKLQAGHNSTWNTISSPTPLSLNTWYHAAVTFSTTTGWRLYLNGVLDSTNSSTSTVFSAYDVADALFAEVPYGVGYGATTTFLGSGEILLGGYGTGSNGFNGRISNASVYNRVLSTSEIQQNYNALAPRFTIVPPIVTSGLVLNLDAGNAGSYSGSGTTWIDISGNNNTGTLVNGPTYSSTNGGSIVFDGTNDRVSFVNGTSVITTNLTIDIIIAVPNPIFSQSGFYFAGIIGLYSDNDYYRECNVQIGNTDNLPSPSTFGASVSFLNSAGNTQNGISFGTFSFSTVPINLTYTQTGNTATTYVNGNFVTTSSITKYTRPGDTNLEMGWVNNFANYGYYRGNIFSTKIYNRALSAAEVSQNFNATRGRFGI